MWINITIPTPGGKFEHELVELTQPPHAGDLIAIERGEDLKMLAVQQVIHKCKFDEDKSVLRACELIAVPFKRKSEILIPGGGA